MGVNNINAQQVTINVSDAILPENNATIDKGSLVGNAVSKTQLQTELTSFKEEVQEMVGTNFRGTIKPTDTAPTEDGTYRPEISSEDDKATSPNDWGTKYPNAGNLRAKKGYDTYFYKKGANWTKTETQLQNGKSAYQIWLDQGNTGTESDFINQISQFNEVQFNNKAFEIGPSTVSLISQDLSAVNFVNSIASGAGSSIFTTKILTSQNLSKLRIKIAAAGKGNFVVRRGTSIIPIVSNINLVAGWNDVSVNFEVFADDYIGYNTKDSTATLFFIDGNGGKYYSLSGGNIVENNGNIALEVYNRIYYGNTFSELLTIKGGTSEFIRLNKYSKPLLRDVDYGVVSFFNLPDFKDVLGNNRISANVNTVSSQIAFTGYAYSFAFTVSLPNKYTATKSIATIDTGASKISISAGGVGIAVNVDNEPNAITYDYSSKNVKIVVVSGAYFLNVYVDGQRIGFLNKGKKATKFSFDLNKLDSKVFDKIVFWRRDISAERVLQWTLDQNPFVLQGIQDRMFPSIGYQISDHLLQNNQYFDIPAEQSIVKFKGKYFLYYTVAKSTPMAFLDGGVGVAISNRPDGGFMPYSDDAVIGGNRSKAGVNRAMASWAGVVGEYVYIFAAMDYTASGAGGKIFKSSNGVDFTLVGNFIPSGIPYLANISIYHEKQPNGYYYGVVEGKPGASWASYLVRSLNFESGWEVVQTLPSIAINPNGMYGGPELTRSANNDRWMLFYHSAYELNGNAPTAIFYAESTEIEPKNWTKKGKVLDINDELDFYSAYNVDQVATPQIFEENGKTYLSIVYAQNEPTLHCQIRMFKLDMTKEELVGMVPINI
ncbi:hypothetical protein [Chryseobacterium indologenes]|uniref:hypothetical protein n=1 Tax=Chryseobacterium indologenes TaxID=253 RepID=UPI003D33CED7